tara:strand:+ start:146 stop:574 length:429 start_codon:yes stop_codon:yes gene_type:complete
MLNYNKILKKNMINVLKDILNNIRSNGLKGDNHLYITFSTKDKKVIMPSWLKKKYPLEMTIIIQHEYYDIKVNENNFIIMLSFNNIKTKLEINYNSIISFADPSANFGLRLETPKTNKKIIKNLKKNNKEGKIIDFSNYKKN